MANRPMRPFHCEMNVQFVTANDGKSGSIGGRACREMCATFPRVPKIAVSQ